MKKITLILIVAFALTSCGSVDQTSKPVPNPVPPKQVKKVDEELTTKFVYNFEECKDAGYPVMESYPRQCRGPDGTVYTEKVKCNQDYEPVCAKVDVVCVTAPCDPVVETITNRCLARERGRDLLGMANGECVEALTDTCSSDSDCSLPVDYKGRNDCLIGLRCIAEQCVVICEPPFGGY